MRTPSRLPVSIRPGLRLFAGGLVLTGLMACGYKGPLYLPAQEAPPAELTAPPTSGVSPTTPEPAPVAR